MHRPRSANVFSPSAIHRALGKRNPPQAPQHPRQDRENIPEILPPTRPDRCYINFMGDRPVIYVSAVSKELQSARAAVASILRTFGYEASWAEVAEDTAADQRHLLERQIDQSPCMVQLVGRCYGSEPPLSARPGGRVSYTQYEAHYARQCGKQVWYFILDRNFPTDPHPPESKEFRILQAAYLRRVRNYQRRHPPIHDTEALRARIFELRTDFAPLRRSSRVWAAAVGILAAVTIGVCVWFFQQRPAVPQNPRDATPAARILGVGL